MSRRGAVPTGVLGGGGGLFTPESHGTALKVWRKADAGVTLTGDEITAWADQVAGGDSAVPASSNRFNLIDPAQNSLPAVNSFGRSGAATLFAADSAIDGFWAGGGGMLVLAGKIVDTSISFGRILSRGYDGDDPGETGWRLAQRGGSNFAFELEQNFSTTRFLIQSTQNNPENVPFVMVLAWDGSSSSTPTLRVNSQNNFNQTSGGNGSIQNSDPAMYNLSRSTLNGGSARMELFEYYFVKPAPVSFNADEGYINLKWAIF